MKYGGDIVKFVGDAMIVLWPPLADPPPALADRARRAGQCALEIQSEFHNKQTMQGFSRLSVKIGLGAGPCSLLHVGGIFGRTEYLIVGAALHEALAAEAGVQKGGEIVAAPTAWKLLAAHFDATPTKADPALHKLTRLTGPVAASRNDTYLYLQSLDEDETRLLGQKAAAYVPAAIRPYL